MKKLMITVLCLAYVITLKAQSKSYQAFKLDLGAGLGVGSDVYPNFTVEPHYRFTDQFALGIRFQEAFTGNLDFTSEGSNNNTYYRDFSSTSLTVDYYLKDGKSTEKVVVFLGAGAGIFTENYKRGSIDTNTDHFGFFPRVGVEINHFRISADYNATGGSTDYFSVGAAYFFWGKKK